MTEQTPLTSLLKSQIQATGPLTVPLRAQARRLTTPLSAAQPEDGHMVWHVWGEGRAGVLPVWPCTAFGSSSSRA